MYSLDTMVRTTREVYQDTLANDRGLADLPTVPSERAAGEGLGQHESQ